MRKLLTLTCLLLSATFTIQAQSGKLSVAFYNVENLFDTLKAPGYEDGDFTPTGTMRWSSEKYLHKINNLGRTISQIGGIPDILGLCEVENATVVEELLQSPALREIDYDFVIFESGDRRGIDIAVVFKIPEVELISAEPLRYTGVPVSGTRNIVHALFSAGGERLHVLACHLPSVPSARKYREAAAASLRFYVDSIASAEPGCKLLVMGDLNNNPGSRIMSRITNADDEMLFNPFEQLYRNGYGSYLYKRRWNMYDNIIVSRSLLSQKGLRYRKGSAHIFVRDTLIQKGGRFEGYPFRSFSGREYIGGYSDHLPVYLNLVF